MLRWWLVLSPSEKTSVQSHLSMWAQIKCFPHRSEPRREMQINVNVQMVFLISVKGAQTCWSSDKLHRLPVTEGSDGSTECVMVNPRTNFHSCTNTQKGWSYQILKYIQLFGWTLVQYKHCIILYKHQLWFPDKLILTSTLLETGKRLTCCFHCLGSHPCTRIRIQNS